MLHHLVSTYFTQPVFRTFFCSTTSYLNYTESGIDDFLIQYFMHLTPAIY